ncbi:MAG: Rpn family recombination-promoting nuclease/putative transposase [Chitinispirillaceae bacterium]
MTDSFLNNPHDRFFKESFFRKETALSFIREYLPEPIIGALEGENQN